MPSTVRTVLVLTLAAAMACAPGATTEERDRRVLAALERSMTWLDQNPVEPSASLGKLGFDAWSWYLFSAWHPDAAVRERAGAETDRRLRALTPPPEWNLVSLSYWATLMRIAQQRGIDLPADPPLPAGAALKEILQPATPTTAYWTEEILRFAGVATEPDIGGILLARGPAAGPGYSPTVADAYAIFHELVPATGLGLEDATLSRDQAEFVRATLPGWVEVCHAKVDVDCQAELLVTMALMDERAELYDQTLDWLLSRTLPDGTYAIANPRNADDFRHVVLVASWALLASLDTFETRVVVVD